MRLQGVKRTVVSIVLGGIISASGIVRGATTLTPSEAARHIGEQATVCGQVASATFASRTRRQPTFLNLDKPYPEHIFTVVIWGADRAAFNPPPEVLYRNKRICVTGQIREYRGRPEMFVASPGQITVER